MRWLLLAVPVAAVTASAVTATATASASASPIPAVQGETISLLAVTDDARAAVTADFGGALRLWPTLDGKREPVVLVGARARELAIARDGDGDGADLVVADLDAAGHLEILRTDALGAARSRARVPADRPFVSVTAVGDGFVAV